MELPLTADQIIIGLIGLGTVAKGIIDHNVKRAPGQSFMCGAEHSVLKDYLSVKFDQINDKLDDIKRKVE